MRLIDANHLSDRVYNSDDTPLMKLYVDVLLLGEPTIDPESLRPQGEWEWFEEWSPSTPEYPAECDDCGWRCGRCKTALEDMVGGYWDDAFTRPMLDYCPNCGAKMKGG